MISHRQRPRLAFAEFMILMALLLFSGCGPSPQQADIPKIDRLALMTDADLVVRCSDTSAFAAALENSPLGRLWRSPEMQATREGQSLEDLIRRALNDAADDENAAQINDIYMAQIKMLNGEFILGLNFNELGTAPAFTTVAAISEADFNRSLEMDKRLHALENEETISASEDFRDTRIYTYIEKQEAGDHFYYQAFYNGTLVMSENRPWLEQALIQLMEAPVKEPGGAPVLTINGKARLIDRLQGQLAQKLTESETPFDLTTLVNSLGFDTLGDIRMQVCMQTDRADMTLEIDRRGEWNRGLMVLIPPEPVPADFRLAYVPPDVASYQVTRLDLNALWRQIPEILRQISPEFQMQFSLGLNAVGGMMDININEDFFNNLDNLAFSLVRFGDQGQEMIYGLNVRDSDAMERTLRKLFADHSPLAAQMSPYYQETDIRGQTIHMLQFPVPADDGQNTIIHEVGLTVVDRALVIGNGSLMVDYVQAAVNNQGLPAFYESRPFRDMLSRLPPEACSYAVSDLSAYVRFFSDEIRTAVASARAHRASPANADEDCGCEERDHPLTAFFDGIAVANLPSTEVMASYFGTSDGYNLIDAVGFRSAWTFHYPEP